MQSLTDEALRQVADFFQMLSEPTRLRILNLLRDGERSVGDLAQLCQSSSANVSRHLAAMSKAGLVRRRSQGNSALYSVADPSIFQLCELVCDRLQRRLHEGLAVAQEHQALFQSPGG